MKTHRQSSLRADSGFTLLEVLIAVVVLATGLLALTALQGALIRASADAKARSQVAAYLAGEMDRIRAGSMPVDKNTSTAAAGDPILLAAKAAALGGLSQEVTVTQYVHIGGVFTAQATPINPGVNAYFNRIELTATWADASGGTNDRSLSISTDISPLSLSASKVLVDRTPPDDLGLRPIVRRESPLTEGMIPIATGGSGNEATAATNPKPELVGGESGTYVSDTRFDILTYSRDSHTPDGFARFNKRIETAIVGCNCQNNLNGFSTTGPGGSVNAFLAAQGFRPAVWNGRAYSDPKPAGTSVNTSPATVSQSQLCDVCCRDHKDPGGQAGPKFSPWAGQTAAHYTAAGVLATSGEYIESCRVIRVGGRYRVAADPKILDNALVPTQAYPSQDQAGAGTGVLVSNNNAATMPLISVPQGRDAYEAYVYGSVASLYFNPNSIPREGGSTDFRSIQDSSGLDALRYVPILVDDKRWLHARAFMVDYLEDDAINQLKKASFECEAPTDAKEKAQCLLPYLPIATINATELASWSARDATADEHPPELASLDLSRLDYASSAIRPHNSGLALFGAINPNESGGIPPALDEQLFAQVGAAAGTPIPPLQAPSPNPSTARRFGDPGNNPMRGYAQTCGATLFNLSWTYPAGNSPPSPVKDSDGNNDPAAIVGAGCACTPNSKPDANPYTCVVSDVRNFQITLTGYNRLRPEAVNNPCGGPDVVKPVLYCYNPPTPNPSDPNSYNVSFLDASGSGLGKRSTFKIERSVGESQALKSIGVTFGAPVRRVVTTGVCSAGSPVWTEPNPDAECP